MRELSEVQRREAVIRLLSFKCYKWVNHKAGKVRSRPPTGKTAGPNI